MDLFKKNRTLGEVKIPALEQKENPVGTLIVGVKEYHTKLVKYKDYADFGYYAVPTVARCVDMLSNSAANIKLELKKVGKDGKDEDVPNAANHPIMKLLARPNPKLGQAKFFASLFKDNYVYGNLFCMADTTASNVPTELWRAQPIKMGIIKGDKGLPTAYEYEAANGKRKFPVDMKGKSSVFHFYNTSLDDDWYGDSPMRPCRTWIDSAREAGEWNTSLLENSGRPSGALKYTGTTALSEEQKAALREQLESKYTGAKNTGKPLLLSGGMEWEQISLSPQEMDFLAGLNYADRKIADNYGIPFPLLSPDAATFSNMDTARESLFEDTIIPFLESFIETFSNWLIPMFPNTEGLKLCIDYSSISAYEAKNQRKTDRLKSLTDSSIITINEAREEIGYEDLAEGGDVPYINAGRVPLGMEEIPDPDFAEGLVDGNKE